MKFILALLTFFVSSAQARILFRGYYRDFEINRFFDHPSMGNFQQIDDNLKLLVMADLMSDPGQKAGSMLQTLRLSYFSHLPLEQQNGILGNAFALALSANHIGEAQMLLNQKNAQDSNGVAEAFCDYIGNLVEVGEEMDENVLKARTKEIEKMLPFLAQHPASAEKNCDLPDYQGSPRLRDLIATSSEQLSYKLGFMIQNDRLQSQKHTSAPAPRRYQENSFCTAKQAQTVFSLAKAAVDGKSVIPAAEMISDQSGDCFIHGLLLKTQVGYQFTLNFAIPAANKDTVFFNTTEQIVTEFLKTQSVRHAN